MVFWEATDVILTICGLYIKYGIPRKRILQRGNFTKMFSSVLNVEQLMVGNDTNR